MKPVVVAGHLCLDLTPALDAPPSIDPGRLIGVGPLAMAPGGCVGNAGPALASLGVPTQLVANAGSDELGSILVALLANSGADTTGIARLDGLGTSYSVVAEYPGRDRTFWHHVGANATFDGSGVIERLRTAAGFNPAGGPVPAGVVDAILHIGYPTLLPGLYENGGAALIALVTAAHAAGATVSVDMAEIAPGSGASAVDWRSVLARTLPSVDVVKASVDDLDAMLPSVSAADPIAWADTLLEFGAAVALVTAGAEGLYVRTAPIARIRAAARTIRDAGSEWADRELWGPAFAASVVTTNGAGDAAAAGFIAGLALGRGPIQAASLSAAAAAARISGRSIGDAYSLVESMESAPELRSGWSLGPDRIFHGPRDGRD